MMRDDDHVHLQRCFDLANRGGRLTAPNPRVGSVVVRDGRVVGEGWHRRAGGDHAEVVALDAAGEAARGSTLYCSLEPCSHQGRTPPCTDRIIREGVARVVVGLVDPDPRVKGAGLAALTAAGIAVDVASGDAARRAEQAIEEYLVHRREGRAFALLKVAATLDGRIADREGHARWITGAAARSHGRRLRDRYGAILVGAGTVLADDPLLMPPGGSGGDPPFLRCVLDETLDTPPGSRLLTEPSGEGSPVVIYASRGADPARRAALEEAGAMVLQASEKGEAVRVDEVLRDLAGRGVLGVVVEGGGQTHGHFLDAGLADKVLWYLAPSVLGDAAAVTAVSGAAKALEGRRRLRIADLGRLEDDLLLTLYPR